MSKILIITKSNINIGTGHITRSNTIYQDLKKYFHTKIIFNENKKIYSKYDILIFDLPNYKNFLKNYVYKEQKIICLDYNGKYEIDLNFSSVKKSKYAKKNSCSIKNIIIPKIKLKTKKKKLYSFIIGRVRPKKLY